MAARLVLHIGVQKSGTTYVQRVLRTCADDLAAAGFGYPLPAFADRVSGRNLHETATYGLLGTEYPWVSEARAAAERGNWQWLAERVREWPGTVVLSAEALSVVREDAARRLLAELDVADVQVVATARGLGSLLPSSWQQHIRNGRTMGFGAFLGRLSAERERGWDFIEHEHGAHMWRAFALGRLAGRWGRIVGPERVTVVTNRGRPPELLWRRFAEAAGLPDGIAPRTEMAAPVHAGLTAAEALVLESLNARMDDLEWPRERCVDLREHLIHRSFAVRPERGPRIAVPPELRTAVEKWSAEDIAELAASGVRIVGDLDELRFDADAEPDAPTAADVSAAAGTAVLAAVEAAEEAAGAAGRQQADAGIGPAVASSAAGSRRRVSRRMLRRRQGRA